MSQTNIHRKYKSPAQEKKRQNLIAEIDFDKKNPGRFSNSKSSKTFETSIKAFRLGLKSNHPSSRIFIEAFDKCRTEEQSDFLYDLLVSVKKQNTKLFDDYYHVHQYNKTNVNGYIMAMVMMSRYHDKCIRKPEEWKRKSHNAKRQFISLSNHLFSKYDVPDLRKIKYAYGQHWQENFGLVGAEERRWDWKQDQINGTTDEISAKYRGSVEEFGYTYRSRCTDAFSRKTRVNCNEGRAEMTMFREHLEHLVCLER